MHSINFAIICVNVWKRRTLSHCRLATLNAMADNVGQGNQTELSGSATKSLSDNESGVVRELLCSNSARDTGVSGNDTSNKINIDSAHKINCLSVTSISGRAEWIWLSSRYFVLLWRKEFFFLFSHCYVYRASIPIFINAYLGVVYELIIIRNLMIC